jgi:DNA-binding transcriptional ArsR family regulator
MARARTTFDPFNAIAEPKRRALIEALAGKELTVNQIVETMGWNQPMVSKHLGVLKQVGLVLERKEGRYRAYKVNVVQEALIKSPNWEKRPVQLINLKGPHPTLSQRERAYSELPSVETGTGMGTSVRTVLE